jgi:hypothetical protein
MKRQENVPVRGANVCGNGFGLFCCNRNFDEQRCRDLREECAERLD